MARIAKEKQRLEDIAGQEAYIKMEEKKEQDRANEMAARAKRQQEFMNRMADGVLKEMDNNQKREDELILQYERMRDLKLKQEEERKAKKRADTQSQINAMN